MSVDGEITAFGTKAIIGWCRRMDGDDHAKVALLVDGVEVNRTPALQIVREGPMTGQAIGFRFGMTEVWEHLRKGQRIELHCNGHPLAYQGQTTHLVISDGARISEPLLERIAAGLLINKFGKLRTPRNRNRKWGRKVFDLYNALNTSLAETFGLPCYAIYGVCLGYARGQGVIGDDVDLDLAYFSEHSDPRAVRDELARVMAHIVQHWPDALPARAKIAFPGRNISLTPSWITDGVFHTTFAFVGGDARVTREDIVPLSQQDWPTGGKVNFPANTQAVARYLYGPGWQTPDPNWHWDREYRAHPLIARAKLSAKQLDQIRQWQATVPE